jgi:RimJ/RimL family protein N-acetyltransferase
VAHLTSRAESLRDGTTVDLRPIEPSDAPALVRFHDTLSDLTSRRRFFNVHPHLSTTEVIRFTTVDHVDREALVVSVDGEIVAVGRIDREPDTPSAEVAFVVSDDWQGRGVGTLLLVRLSEWARRMGVSRLTADTLSDNRPMIDLFQHSGLVTATRYDRGVLQLTLTL